MNIGGNDLAAGMEFIKELESQANFPFISSNITALDSEALLFPKHAIVETHDRTLGFVGVSSGDRRLKEFTFQDPIAAAQKSIDEIKDRVDLIFLLANVDDKTELKLTKEVDGFDFLLRSKTASLQRNPKEKDGKVIIRIGKQGKYAGVLRIRSVDDISPMKNVSSQYTRIKFAENRLSAMKKGLDEGKTLEEHYADDEKRLKLIERLRNEHTTNVELIKKLHNSYYLEAIPLNEKIEDTPEVAAIVKDYMPVDKKKAEKHK